VEVSLELLGCQTCLLTGRFNATRMEETLPDEGNQSCIHFNYQLQGQCQNRKGMDTESSVLVIAEEFLQYR